MRSADLRILQTARRWPETSPIWLCTLLRTYGSSPRPPAAMMVLTGDGRYCGSLSGGCIKENFIVRACAGNYCRSLQHGGFMR